MEGLTDGGGSSQEEEAHGAAGVPGSLLPYLSVG
jgi:hypothetical protein